MNRPIQPADFIMMPIPASAYIAVCALLGGAIHATGSTGSGNVGVGDTDAGPSGAAEPSGSAAEASQDAAITGGGNAPAGDVEIDAGGHPWSPDLHASTKGKTKDGYWRMKVGVSRPDPLPGFPKDSSASVPAGDTGTSSATDTSIATSQTATDSASDQPATSGDEDEFAAFRAAAAVGEATDAAAAASVPARQFSDADLGALCNQAAVKLGDPTPVKEIIARYVPEGEVAHSRNIPADKREEFAKEVEAKAGIQFAG